MSKKKNDDDDDGNCGCGCLTPGCLIAGCLSYVTWGFSWWMLLHIFFSWGYVAYWIINKSWLLIK